MHYSIATVGFFFVMAHDDYRQFLNDFSKTVIAELYVLWGLNIDQITHLH